ncbi:hypothetical protein GCG54_00001653 [Colletotrichum gloeosporioides]|uniref:Uncharacterized protein n=1 Tax=Colletotrichum gloeosporioides TaxID=474922 RepID=A0A8H4CWL9_COLGL|nr:uncharacterized protein GCG54_00001653 [Colletotrichum gloeosporioides]KAF3811335.1 hypothetical protein GCG54_00001653 [Colletotrichum gloeosporioides]
MYNYPQAFSALSPRARVYCRVLGSKISTLLQPLVLNHVLLETMVNRITCFVPHDYFLVSSNVVSFGVTDIGETRIVITSPDLIMTLADENQAARPLRTASRFTAR